jgi:hypothetical protein
VRVALGKPARRREPLKQPAVRVDVERAWAQRQVDPRRGRVAGGARKRAGDPRRPQFVQPPSPSRERCVERQRLVERQPLEELAVEPAAGRVGRLGRVRGRVPLELEHDDPHVVELEDHRVGDRHDPLGAGASRRASAGG